jgi:hypothetical protein
VIARANRQRAPGRARVNQEPSPGVPPARRCHRRRCLPLAAVLLRLEFGEPRQPKRAAIAAAGQVAKAGSRAANLAFRGVPARLRRAPRGVAALGDTPSSLDGSAASKTAELQFCLGTV